MDDTHTTIVDPFSLEDFLNLDLGYSDEVPQDLEQFFDNGQNQIIIYTPPAPSLPSVIDPPPVEAPASRQDLEQFFDNGQNQIIISSPSPSASPPSSPSLIDTPPVQAPPSPQPEPEAPPCRSSSSENSSDEFIDNIIINNNQREIPIVVNSSKSTRPYLNSFEDMIDSVVFKEYKDFNPVLMRKKIITKMQGENRALYDYIMTGIRVYAFLTKNEVCGMSPEEQEEFLDFKLKTCHNNRCRKQYVYSTKKKRKVEAIDLDDLE